MVLVTRRRMKFVKKLEDLVKNILKNEFKITKTVINQYSTDRVYFKFANRYSIYGSISQIKEELCFQIAYNIFIAYEKENHSIDIIDKPEGCDQFKNFRDVLYSTTNFEKTLTDYFKNVLVFQVYAAGVKTYLSNYFLNY
jgi:hypothetical protein